jgi:hypothetical protein
MPPLGIATDPALVISPVPRTPPTRDCVRPTIPGDPSIRVVQAPLARWLHSRPKIGPAQIRHRDASHEFRRRCRLDPNWRTGNPEPSNYS